MQYIAVHVTCLKNNFLYSSAQEQKITKYRQLAHDNKLEMTKQEEVCDAQVRFWDCFFNFFF